MKTLKIVALLALAMVTSTIMVGCGNKDVDKSFDIDTAIETKIKKDWQVEHGYSLSAINYYGTHSGYVAFFVPGDNTVVTNVKIAGTIFRYGNDWTIWLWKDGVFSNMIDTYLQGFLTAKNIEDIGAYHIQAMKSVWLGESSDFDEWYFADDVDSIIE